jgi:hypothetical protein
MDYVKRIFTVSVVLVAMAVMIGCGQKQAEQKWEYKVEHFSRDDHDIASKLKTLGDSGWEYAGPLANNGTNAKYVAFKRPK